MGACSQRALAVQKSCHGCCGLKIRAITGFLAFPSTTGENLVYCSKAFGKILQERRHCLGLMTQPYSWGQPFLSSFHCGGPPTQLAPVSGCIRSLRYANLHEVSCVLSCSLPTGIRHFCLSEQLLTCWFPRRGWSLAAYICGQIQNENFLFF